MVSPEEARQIEDIINASSRILIIPGASSPSDTLPASLALSFIAQQYGKEAVLFYPHNIPSPLSFLPFEMFHVGQLSISQDHVLRINTQTHPVQNIRSEQEGDYLSIILTSQTSWSITPDDITISSAPYPYDCIITVGIPSLIYLGKPFHDNTNFFYETPLINIDTNEHNQKYGTLPLVNPSIFSCAEYISRIAKTLGKGHIHTTAATALLTGIIAQTHNFQHPQITPQTLFSAAYLISKQADQQLIVRSLYKMKSLELIRLWGKAMARLKYENDIQAGWTILTRKDLSEARMSNTDIHGLVEEIRNNFSQAQYLIIIWEDINTNCAHSLIHSYDLQLLDELEYQFQGTREGNNLVLIPEKIGVSETAEHIIGKIKTTVKERL